MTDDTDRNRPDDLRRYVSELKINPAFQISPETIEHFNECAKAARLRMEAGAINLLFPELVPPEPEPTWQDRLDEAIDRIKAAIDVLRYGVPY